MIDIHFLSSLTKELYLELKDVYFLLLPLFFLISILITWFKGSYDFIDKIKKVFISTILVVIFPEITDIILFIANGLSDKIGSMNTLENIMHMAGEKMKEYSKPSLKSFLSFPNLLLASLCYISFFVVYCAKFIMLAVYHFSWSFLLILSPLILLFHVFSQKITLSLFRSMIEIASWKVVWVILSVMLNSLPFSNPSEIEGHYITLIIMNFVIALCMLGTPFLIKSLIGSGFSTFAGSINAITGTTMMATYSRAVKIGRMSKKRLLKRICGFPEVLAVFQGYDIRRFL